MTQLVSDQKIICYRLVTTGEEHGIVLFTSQLQEIKPAMIELRKWANENGWTLILSEGGEGDCLIQQLTAN